MPNDKFTASVTDMVRKVFASAFLYTLVTVPCACAEVCSHADSTPTPSICSNVGPYCVLDTNTRLCIRDCSQIDASSCGSYPGCTLDGGFCTQCPQGSYCPGGNIVKSCPEPFSKPVRFAYSGNNSVTPRLDITGNDSINSCYAETTCGTDKVYIGCPGHWDETNRKCPPPPLNDNKPNVQWAYNYTHESGPHPTAPLLPKERSDWLDGYLDVFYNNDNINTTYHLEVKAQYTDQPYNGGNLGYIWKEDSVAEIMCVPNTISCSTFNQYGYNCTQYDDNQPACNDHTNNGCRWISTNSLPNKCVYRDDVGATASNTHCSTNATLSGTARWWTTNYDDINNPDNPYPGQEYWDVSGCTCTENTNTLNEDRKCYGHGTFKAIQSNPNSENINPVHSIWEHIIFNDNDPEDFLCVKCAPGPYYANYLAGIKSVDSCIEVPGFGYYREQSQSNYCNDNNNNGVTWSYNSNGQLDNNPCARKPCPVGKTTSVLGPIGSGACHYTDQTKFCDAKGCFHIDDAPGNWNWGL